MQSRNVIIFSYYWPPASTPGVWRFLKFAKYLPEFGWNPIVVTPRNGSYSNYDESLLEKVSKDVITVRTKTLEPFQIYNLLQGKKGKKVPEAMSNVRESKALYQRFSKFIRANFFVPDARVGWVRYGKSAGRKLINTKDIHAIITTGPPQSAHLIGLALKREFQIPWIVDFRDPWTSNYIIKEFLNRSNWSERKDQKYEDEVVRSCDLVTGISAGLVEEFADRARQTEVILNGYDDDDFRDLAYEVRTEHFCMSFIGSCKPNHDIPAMWEALFELVHEDENFKKRFRLKFIGNRNATIEEKLKKGGLESNLLGRDYIPHDQAIKEMQAANLLLFIVPQAAYSKSITSGKVFEFMGSRTPILAVGPTDGEAAKILQTAGRAPMLDYTDKTAIKTQLLGHFRNWEAAGGVSGKVDHDQHAIYGRRLLTKKLATFLDQIST